MSSSTTRGRKSRPHFLGNLLYETKYFVNRDRCCTGSGLVGPHGGEHRLSDFLLFECAYAELEFLDSPWPEFRPANLAACLEHFRRRDRRFGGPTRIREES